MNCKEDLIGTGWKCPICSGVEIITNTGMEHNCKNYCLIKRLDQCWIDYNESKILNREDKNEPNN